MNNHSNQLSNGSHANGSTKMRPEDSAGLQTIPIAVVGMACRFAGGIRNPEDLWDLASQGKNSWSKIPEARFNIEAFRHARSDKTDSTHIKGGYFLDEDVGLFDHSFFNFSSLVAAAIDPQIRLMLEVTYESLESAGIRSSDIAGSNTAVYAGTFTKDYHDHLVSDPLHVPSGLLTGNYTAMVANRISHFFDLKGPSVALDTGCSTSMVGLHFATQSLRSGESDCAIVGGGAVNINSESFINTATVGSCGPDGKCFAFDHRAQGYGRGEGIAVVVLKRLDDAIQAGDPIRAIIRETASNQDGKTSTITSPDIDAQYHLIRACYEKAGLDPLQTPVVEAHGTGTKAGDPIEASAIGRALRPKERRGSSMPVYIASVKTNIGHTEAVSGLAGLIKMAKSLEKGQIAPSINFEKANPDIDLESLGVEVSQKLHDWPKDKAHRASINNFGYGGTNVHVILEADPRNTAPDHTNGTGPAVNGIPKTKIEASMQKLFVLSARDEEGVRQMAANLCKYLQKPHQTIDYPNLAYTLGQRRSRFPWSFTLSAQSSQSLAASLADEKSIRPKRALNKYPRLGFVFNGQGSQYFSMGRELMKTYPVYLQQLQKCDDAIRNMGAEWSIIDELQRSEQDSKVNQVKFSMPLICAIQLALVALLTDWGVTPSAVVGHSTGEIAAAYAAGAIKLEEAMAASYYRGLVNSQHLEGQQSQAGSMLAAGLGPDQVEPYLSKVAGRAVIACYNSPSSVTLSGDLDAIEELEKELKDAGFFARKLKVQAAFHSHHMKPLAGRYGQLLEENMHRDTRTFADGVQLFSAVTGSELSDAQRLGPSIWLENMLNPVLFTQAFNKMLIPSDTSDASSKQNVDFIVEIGPHSALAGPLRQSLTQPSNKGLDVSYGSCLERGKDAVEAIQILAGSLHQAGYKVEVDRVNFPREVDHGALVAIADLPSYPWNHKTKFWSEPRSAHDRRFRSFPSHDLLGVRVPGLSDRTMVWRHVLRCSDLPWIRHHVVQSQVVYPGAGYVAMAIEAIRQVHHSQNEAIRGYSLRDVEITRALVVPDDTEGVEVQLSLEAPEDRFLVQHWRRFRISSAPDNNSPWHEVATGLVSARIVTADKLPIEPKFQLESSQKVDPPGARGSATTTMKPRDLFAELRTYGINHGPIFQNFQGYSVLCDGRSSSSLEIADPTSLTEDYTQEPHVIHPTTLDSLFVATYLSLHARAGATKVVGAAVPRSIKQMYISADISNEPGSLIQARTQLRQYNKQGFSVLAVAESASRPGVPVIEINDMYLQSLGRGAGDEDAEKAELCLTTQWKRSFSLNDQTALVQSIRRNAPDDETRLGRDLVRSTFYLVSEAIKQLTDDDVSRLEWYNRKYYDWMVRFVNQAKDNGLGKGSSAWDSKSEGLKQSLIDRVETCGPSGELSVRIGKNLVGILRKEIAPLELMVQDELLQSYYRHGLRFARSAEHVAACVRAMADENPCLRILEIGGGTAGCTLPVLQSLGDGSTSPQLFEHYTFTDISAGFLSSAREELAPWGNSVTYTTLDIEKDPQAQGFDLGAYDVVIAAQVLHATKDLSKTMAHVRSLIKDDGKLVMIETTHDRAEIQLIFGALPGWWLSKEPERQNSPNMPLEAWDACFKSSGFSGLDLHVWDCDDEDHQAMSCLVSTADARSVFDETATLVYDGDSPPADWLQSCTDCFKSDLGVALNVQPLSSADVKNGVCILLFRQGDSAQDFDEPTFNSIKAIITSCKGLIGVAAGSAVACERPDNAVHQGLLRTARCEDTSKRFVSLDLDSTQKPWTTQNISTIVKVFRSTMDWRLETSSLDQEYAFRGSDFLVPRMGLDVEENNSLHDLLHEREPEMQRFLQDEHALRMMVETPGLIDSIVFKEDPGAAEALAEDYVHIQPQAFGLNFKDVMGVMGMLKDPNQAIGCECAGVVRRIGPNCQNKNLKVGDRVCCLMPNGHIANHVRIPSTSVSRIPDSMSFEMAAAVPVVFITAWYSLFNAGRCEPEDTVLIHAASGGVGQACIIAAQWKGIKDVFVTVGTQEKRDFLHSTYGIAYERMFSSRDESFATDILKATGGRGVDVVINSLSGNLLSRSFELLAPHGRFVEIGKRDIVTNRSLDMEAFNRALSFTHVDVKQMSSTQGRVLERLFKEILSLLGSGEIPYITPIKQFSLSELSRALRIMQAGQHIGKLVLVPNDDDLVKTIPLPPRAKLRPDATYMIVGGSSGIGLSVAQLLARRGAGNLLLVSRNATAKGKIVLEGNANVVVKDCDVGDRASFQKLLDDCRALGLPAIRGVMNGGMVLDDAILERMTYSQWSRALHPKLHGTRNIHDLVGQDLDFFISLSSLSGIVGNPSQSNYGAGNTYQDALARHRSAKGLPATVIDFGPVSQVGYLADKETDDHGGRLAKILDHRSVTEAEVLGLIERAICSPLRHYDACQVHCGMAGTGSAAASDPRFAMLKQWSARRRGNAGGSDSAGRQNGSGKHLSEDISGADSSESATELVQEALIAKVSDMFALDEAEVDPGNSLNDFGVDSLVAVELRNWLVSNARIEMSIFQLLQSSSLTDLAGTVVKHARPAVQSA